MQDEEVIANQQQLLDAHRSSLVQLLQQEARFGPNYVPVHITTEIGERRKAIRHIKAGLRQLGVKVPDLPFDEPYTEQSSAPGASKKTASSSSRKPLTENDFLAQAPSEAVPLLKRLLADGSAAPLLVEWHPTSFSIKVPLDGHPVGIVYAYPQRLEVYFGYLTLPETELRELRDALLRLDVGWVVTDKMIKVPLEGPILRESAQFSEDLTRQLRELAQRHVRKSKG